MNNQWLKETNDIIADWEAEYNSLQSKYERIAGELMDLRQRIAVAHELISAYMEKHDESSENPTIIITNLTNKSYPKILVEAAKQNNGIIDVSVLVDILVKADMGTPAQVRHNIDNALYRNKEHFARIGRADIALLITFKGQKIQKENQVEYVILLEKLNQTTQNGLRLKSLTTLKRLVLTQKVKT